MAIGKRLKKAREGVDREKLYPLADAIKMVKERAKSKFDETIEISINLGVDPRHADQMVRGVVNLPNGTGRTLRVGVFARGAKADEARAAGADVVGAEDLVENRPHPFFSSLSLNLRSHPSSPLQSSSREEMGRGVSAGGGQSSLGYLFGGGDNNDDTTRRAPKNEGQKSDNVTATTTPVPPQPTPQPPVVDNTQQITTSNSDGKSTADNSNTKQSPTGSAHESKKNNYFRPDGQNCGNFITDRPSTKVHAAPGGGSSLGYLFGDGKN
jgi:hypothetical protein